MTHKLPAPILTGQPPQIGIVFQSRDFFCGKPGHAGLQQLQQAFRLIARLHRLKRAQHKPGHRLPVHPVRLGHKAGNVPLFQGGVQTSGVPLGTAANDGDFPVAVAFLRHQPADLRSGVLRLLIGIPGRKHGDPFPVLRGHGRAGGKQLGLHQFQILIAETGRSREHHRRQHLHTVFLSCRRQPGPSAVHQGEQPCARPVQAVGTQGHHHLVRLLQNPGEHCQLLGGKAFEGIHRHGASPEKRAALQSLGQTGQVVPGVQVGGLHQGIVCIVEQGKLRELLAQAGGSQLPGGLLQIPRRDTAELHLADRSEHHVRDPAALGCGGVHLQPVLTGLNG